MAPTSNVCEKVRKVYCWKPLQYSQGTERRGGNMFFPKKCDVNFTKKCDLYVRS